MQPSHSVNKQNLSIKGKAITIELMCWIKGKNYSGKVENRK